jgi:hypothetical protein
MSIPGMVLPAETARRCPCYKIAASVVTYQVNFSVFST